MTPVALAAWNEPLTADEREELLAAITRRVHKWRLEAPTILALETHRPLAFVASQGMVALTPLIGVPADFLVRLLLGIDLNLNRVQQFSRLLAEPGGVDALIARLEEAR